MGVVMVTWLFWNFAFAAMQRVARVCQRLSYLLTVPVCTGPRWRRWGVDRRSPSTSLLGRTAMSVATDGVAWSVCMSVCQSRPWDLQKWLNWSRCRLEGGVGWAQGTMASTPSYLSDMLHTAAPARQLRSSAAPLLIVPCTRSDTAGRAFSVAALSVWNSLPPDIRLCDTTTATFKWHLKTHLFSQT